MAEPTLSSYDPTLRDRLAWAVSDFLGGDNRSRRNYLNEKVRGVVDFVPGLGDAVGFDEAKRDFDAGNYGNAALGTTLSTIGSVPGVGDALAAGGKAMFLGLGAKNLDPKKLERFADIVGVRGDLPNDYDKNAALKETGFFQGVDGMPRFEISDKDAKIKQTTGHNTSAPLGELLDHPELFAAYPELQNMSARITEHDPYMEAGAEFWPPNYDNPLGKIIVRDGKKPPKGQFIPPDMFETEPMLLHELQHWIQEIEGWDSGANAAMPGFSKVGQAIKQLGDETFSQLPYASMFNLDDEASKGAHHYLNMKEGVLSKMPDNYFAYLHKSGETEARNTARRRNMTGAQRKQYGPWATQDIPNGFQVTDDDIAMLLSGLK